MILVILPVLDASSLSRSRVESTAPDDRPVPDTIRSGEGAAVRLVTLNSFSSFATAKANFTGSLISANSLALDGFLPHRAHE